MSSEDHIGKGEVWVPAGRWRHGPSWRRRMDDGRPETPGWYEPKPVKRRPAVTVIGLLWVVIPCLLLLGQYGEHEYQSGWRELKSQVGILEEALVEPEGFKEFAVVSVCDPAWSLIDRIHILTEATDEALTKPDRFDDEMDKTRSELAALMAASHGLSVPSEYRQKYELIQLSLLSAGQALDALEVATNSPNPGDKARFYAESVEQSRNARDKLWEARKFFESYAPVSVVCSTPGYSR